MGRGKQKAAKDVKKFWQNLTCLQQTDEAEDEISSDEETTKNNKKTKKAKPKKTKKKLQKNSDIWIGTKWNWERDRWRDLM